MYKTNEYYLEKINENADFIIRMFILMSLLILLEHLYFTDRRIAPLGPLID